ncbi:hypothetical protein VST7929_01361 [Vibrio stylophorae]|uniref:Nitrogen fixation protein FixH n=1 Tax=Vibrio stylophorae TaxID=659351 RepID=A0ABM8ZT45_9VIBR|nr:FixH family protein [Vibrio stylophorae]CAH0533491.1 hypothetical protein VST7929_01361 [Vibrio stylophorae]
MEQPWYRQFWPWVLIALPLSVVCASFFTLWLFQNNPVAMVVDDYYKKGKAINQDLSKRERALNLAIEARFWQEGTQGVLTLQSKHRLPADAINIQLVHRTLDQQDVSFLMNKNGLQQYRIDLPEDIKGPWSIILKAHDDSWMIRHPLTFPIETPIQFNALSEVNTQPSTL